MQGHRPSLTSARCRNAGYLSAGAGVASRGRRPKIEWPPKNSHNRLPSRIHVEDSRTDHHHSPAPIKTGLTSNRTSTLTGIMSKNPYRPEARVYSTPQCQGCIARIGKVEYGQMGNGHYEVVDGKLAKCRLCDGLLVEQREYAGWAPGERKSVEIQQPRFRKREKRKHYSPLGLGSRATNDCN